MTPTSTSPLRRLAMTGMLLGLAVCASFTANAQANLTVTNGYQSSVSVSLTGHVPNPFSLLAGSFFGTLTGGPLAFPTNFEAYCVDINTAVRLGPPGYNVNLVTPTSRTSWLGTNAIFLYAQHPGFTRIEQRTAMQLAIWNTIYDTDNSVTPGAGTFSDDVVTANIENLANLYLTDSIGKSSPGTQFVDTLGASHSQTLLFAGTPEPGTVAYLSVFGAGFLAVVRGRLRKSGARRQKG